MAIRVERKDNREPLEKLLKRFKKKCDNADLLKDYRKNEYYESKSEKRRRDKRKLLKRLEKERKEDQHRSRHRR